MTPVAPPGEGPYNSQNKNIDSVAFALERIITNLAWADERRHEIEAARSTDPSTVESELRYLADDISSAKVYLERLIELLMAGYGIDPSKELPPGLIDRHRNHPSWPRLS